METTNETGFVTLYRQLEDIADELSNSLPGMGPEGKAVANARDLARRAALELAALPEVSDQVNRGTEYP